MNTNTRPLVSSLPPNIQITGRVDFFNLFIDTLNTYVIYSKNGTFELKYKYLQTLGKTLDFYKKGPRSIY